MRTIVAGSRDIQNYSVVCDAVGASGFEITTVISGEARGVDLLGERWGREHNVPVEGFPADWKRHGKKAGVLRNIQMLENADALIAIWDVKSKGTKHMIDVATMKGLKVYVACVD